MATSTTPPGAQRQGEYAHRVWVPGTGIAGTAVARRLLSLGIEHETTGRLEVDLTDPSTVFEFVAGYRPTAVINCAAYTDVDGAESDRATAEAVNAQALKTLGQACAKHDTRLVHISTDYVFDGAATEPIDEDTDVSPLGTYGETKRHGEQILEQICGETRASVDILRTSWLFGPGGKNFVQTMTRLLTSRPEVQVVDDQWGRPTYAHDLAAVLVDLALKDRPREPKGSFCRLWHFANEGPTTWCGLAKTIAEVLRAKSWPVATIVPVPSATFPRPAPRPAYSILATGKIETELGKPCPHWRQGLVEYLDSL